MTHRRSDIIRELADREKEAEDYAVCLSDLRAQALLVSKATRKSIMREIGGFTDAYSNVKRIVTALESELGYVRREG